ncbi:hypothetical protein B0H17DRAFT_1198170 [Mycena rosella]|uniref:Uncharacterized protein n=1 Tax=Mycena rosella TaxID=1033263 RepID=A0AAD7DQY0_MYCRO|nr:hypothetical protein B0H17DRAFT_1198170 [Mycena rosella]
MEHPQNGIANTAESNSDSDNAETSQVTDKSPNKKIVRISATDDAPSHLPDLRFNRERGSPDQRKISGSGEPRAPGPGRLPADIFSAEVASPTRKTLILGALKDTPPGPSRRQFLRGRSESPTPASRSARDLDTGHHETDVDASDLEEGKIRETRAATPTSGTSKAAPLSYADAARTTKHATMDMTSLLPAPKAAADVATPDPNGTRAGDTTLTIVTMAPPNNAVTQATEAAAGVAHPANIAEAGHDGQSTMSVDEEAETAQPSHQPSMVDHQDADAMSDVKETHAPDPNMEAIARMQIAAATAPADAGHNYIFDNPRQAAEHAASIAREKAATAAKMAQEAQDVLLAAELHEQQVRRAEKIRRIATNIPHPPQARLPTTSTTVIQDADGNITIDGVLFPNLDIAAAAPPTHADLNPHRLIPAESADPEGPEDAWRVNETQPNEGNWPHLVIPAAHAYDNVHETQLAKILEDPRRHLLTVPFVGGRRLTELIPELPAMCLDAIKGCGPPSSFTVIPATAADLTYTKYAGMPSVYAGPIILIIVCHNERACENVRRKEVHAKDQVAAFSIIGPEDVEESWTSTILVPSFAGGEPETRTECRKSIMKFIWYDTLLGTIIQRGLAPARPSQKHALPSPSLPTPDGANTRKHTPSSSNHAPPTTITGRRSSIASTRKPSLLATIPSRQSTRWPMSPSDPAASYDTHPAWACPFIKDPLWWGPRDQLSNITEGRLACGGGRGGGHRGNTGVRGTRRARGTTVTLESARQPPHQVLKLPFTNVQPISVVPPWNQWPLEDIDVRVGRSESPTAVGMTPGSRDKEKELDEEERKAEMPAGTRSEGDVPPDGEELMAEWQKGHHRIIERCAGPSEEIKVEAIRTIDGERVSSAYRGPEVVVRGLVEKLKGAPCAMEPDPALGRGIEERLAREHHHHHAHGRAPTVSTSAAADNNDKGCDADAFEVAQDWDGLEGTRVGLGRGGCKGLIGHAQQFMRDLPAPPHRMLYPQAIHLRAPPLPPPADVRIRKAAADDEDEDVAAGGRGGSGASTPLGGVFGEEAHASPGPMGLGDGAEESPGAKVMFDLPDLPDNTDPSSSGGAGVGAGAGAGVGAGKG